MTKRRQIGLFLAGAALLLLIFYVWGPSPAPSGQERLLTLSATNFSEFEKAFDGNADVPRLVLLLSPT